MNTPLHALILAALTGSAATPERLTSALTSSLTRPPYNLNGPTPANLTLSVPVTPGQVRHTLRELLSTGEVVTDASSRATRRQYTRQRPGNVIDPLALPGTLLRRVRVTPDTRVLALLPHLSGRDFSADEVASVSRLPLSAVTLLLEVQVQTGALTHAPARKARRPLPLAGGPVTLYRHAAPAPTPVPDELDTPDLAIFAQAAALALLPDAAL
ncbi:hypothetical protein [Deinococcus arenicola]|uniref:DprA winged helix domain-containing protein n=1 Tax=Deinococcus arenicola TaxID=2994950 RepID=A0ABU4DVH8_9DEIO|nr:hypothetical protein [Deinococcus sp. ZS9-10]MDV6376442.1 hypothetical protein [Deinococcus sp. ZS9-10]